MPQKGEQTWLFHLGYEKYDYGHNISEEMCVHS